MVVVRVVVVMVMVVFDFWGSDFVSWEFCVERFVFLKF